MNGTSKPDTVVVSPQVLELVEEAGEDVEDDDGAVAAALGARHATAAAAIAEPGAVAGETTSVMSVYMLQVKTTPLAPSSQKSMPLSIQDNTTHFCLV